MNDNEPSPPRVVPPSHRRTVALTHVELTWIEKKIEHWLRFGHRAEEKISIAAAASQASGRAASSHSCAGRRTTAAPSSRA
jgi:hypothetical protein